MSILVDLSEQEIADLKAFTDQTEPTAAVHFAIIDFLRRAHRIRLKSLSGMIEMDDNSKVLEAAELDSPKRNSSADAT